MNSFILSKSAHIVKHFICSQLCEIFRRIDVKMHCLKSDPRPAE